MIHHRFDHVMRSAMKRLPKSRALRLVIYLAIGICLVPIVLVPVYSLVNPPASTLMLWTWATGGGVDRRWVPIDAISKNLVRAVVMAEDGRFCEHSGIDWREVQNAIDAEGGRPRGASTITMQLVKNLFLWTSRSYLRKGLEVPLALYADLVLSKRRIVEIYLNTVEWGPGIFGAEAAGQRYFKRPAAKLSRRQAALMAAALPNPTARNPAKPSTGHRRIANRIAGRARKSGGYLKCVLEQ